MTTDMRSKLIGFRVDEEEMARLERLRLHFAAKYPPPPGSTAEMSVSQTIKIALTLVERAEIGPPPAPSSRPQPKKPRAPKR